MKRTPFYLNQNRHGKLRSPVKPVITRHPFHPNEIQWMVSPDHCSPYRRLTGFREPEPPYVPPEPPEPPDVDPRFFQVVLLVGSESGLNLDESLYHHMGSAGGGGGVSTTNAAFGHNSVDPVALGNINFGGGDWTGVDEFNLSPTQMSEFTIEAWIYLNSSPTTIPYVIVGRSFLAVQWAFLVEPPDKLRFAYQTLESGFGGNGKFTNIISNSAGIVPHRWYHAAVAKDAAKHFRLFLDGVMVGKRTPNDATIDNTTAISQINVGQIGLFGTNNWQGQIDELRITKGAARYRSDLGFPKPRRAWPRPPPTTTMVRSWENAESLREDA